MVLATNLGFPRVGADRELKKATEAYWKGTLSREELDVVAQELATRHWTLQQKAGIAHIPSFDFALYDHVLHLTAALGCIPARYNWDGGKVDNDLYFAMARGNDKVTAMEMTKWFDTNYHYIVPEFEEGQAFKLSCDLIFKSFEAAKAAGIAARPVIVGPVSYLLLGKKKSDFCRLTLLPGLLKVYAEILNGLKARGAEWVQIDEPFLALDLDDSWKTAYTDAYAELRKSVPDLKILTATYFEALRENTELAFSLPVQAVHIDLVRAPDQLDAALKAIKKEQILSLGLVDGRNIWKNDLSKSLTLAEKAIAALGSDRVWIGPSCSLLHTPIDLALESKLDPQVKSWMAYATQKLDEIAAIAKGAASGRQSVAAFLEESDRVVADRKTSSRIHNKDVKARVAAITPDMLSRKSPFAARRKAQQDVIKLPAYPTTTIGSFPQTADIRKARADFKKGTIDAAAYETAMKKEIEHVVRYQEKIDLDVLVHGEAERNDMVEYFGEQLSGFAFSQNGWVQSYGSRCVKPPIIFGDISRPTPMTVAWSKYAQSLTSRPMKGMLTGPITILQWSFVRDDQPRSETSRQIALAIRDEVADLEAAGITIIQIDEAALREGLPLRKADWKQYLKNAVDDFRITSCTVEDSTQIHTHMCYSDFNEIIDSIAAMDADVISIETSRSQMELLNAFQAFKYPNEIGPGVYDIHSPRIPTEKEMVDLLDKAAAVIDPSLLWVNPDCGLKTRGWKEVEPALEHMVKAAKSMRAKAKQSAAA